MKRAKWVVVSSVMVVMMAEPRRQVSPVKAMEAASVAMSNVKPQVIVLKHLSNNSN